MHGRPDHDEVDRIEPGGGTKPVAALALAVLCLVGGATCGALAARFVVGLLDIRDLRTDLVVTMVATALATATTAYLLCERLLPRPGHQSRHAAQRVVRRACVLGGFAVAGLLWPLTPQSWLQVLPASAFVTLTGGIGVAAAAGRSRVGRRA